MTKYLTLATGVALLIGAAIGIAYGPKIPVLYPLAKKLPGASV